MLSVVGYYVGIVGVGSSRVAVISQ